MFNIVLIDGDKKIAPEIEKLLIEISDDVNFVTCPSSDEFEKLFCSNTNVEKPMDSNILLKDFNEDERTLLIQREFAAQTQGDFALTFNAEFDSVIQFEPEKDSEVLGYPKTEILGQRQIMTTLIQQLFRSRWTAAVEQIQKNQKESSKKNQFITLSLVMINKLQNIHFMEATLRLDETGQLIVRFKDLKSFVMDSILKERERRTLLEKEEKEIRPFATINMIYLRPQSVRGSTTEWIDRIFPVLKSLHYFPEEALTRFVVLKYEDDGLSPRNFIHPRIDDVIHLPVDRLLFLQKSDIFLNLPKSVGSRFLFKQAVQQQIEVSKLVTVLELSDVGLAILNPVPLKEGTFGNFYLELHPPNVLQVYGKVLKNEFRPEDEHFVVHFGFTGIQRSQQTDLRKFLGRKVEYRQFVDEAEAKFAYNPDDLFLTDDQKRLRQIVLLDSDENQLDHMSETLHRELEQIRVHSETSYLRLLQLYFSPNSEASDLYRQRLQATRAINSTDVPPDPFQLLIQPETKTISRLLGVSNETQFLGHSVADWIGKDSYIKVLFPDKDLTENFEEAFGLVASERPMVRTFLCQAADGKYCALTVHLTLQLDGLIQMKFRVPDSDGIKRRMSIEKPLDTLDIILMDSAFLPSSIDSFLTGLESLAKQKGVLKPDRSLAVIVLIDPIQAKTLDVKKYSHPLIKAVLIKPLDPRLLAFTISVWTKNIYTKFRFDNIGWLSMTMNAQMATDMVLEEIAEFGATMRYPTPLAPGGVLFLHKSIFENAPKQMIAARFYRCEEHPSEKDQYLCYVTYFGMTDAFAKFARRYFRESYAQSKSKEEG
jgi:hypothetical protein